MTKTTEIKDNQAQYIDHDLTDGNGPDAMQVDGDVSWLGLEVGDLRLLVNLVDIVEVLPVPSLQAVPLVKPWFRGMSNVRGNLYGVSDLAHFIALEPTSNKSSNRILLLNSVQTTQSAILVDGVLGLKNIKTLQTVTQRQEVGKADEKVDHVLARLAPHLVESQHLFTNEYYQDHDGHWWLTLSVDALARDAKFINPSIV